MSPKLRQEVFNVILAQVLQERGIITVPEKIINIGPDKIRRMPDLIVGYNGLRTIIEGEIASRPTANDNALNSARKRVVEGIAHIGIALVYPIELQDIEFINLKSEFMKCEFDINIISESMETGFVKGNIDYLDNILRHTFDQLVQEDIVAKAVAVIDAGIENFANNVISLSGNIERLADCLGIRELNTENIEEK